MEPKKIVYTCKVLSYGMFKVHMTEYSNYVIQEVAGVSFLDKEIEVHRDKVTYSSE